MVSSLLERQREISTKSSKAPDPFFLLKEVAEMSKLAGEQQSNQQILNRKEYDAFANSQFESAK